ncbi:MAG: DM13 domain-containing protein [Patescibacteria group bacterium]
MKTKYVLISIAVIVLLGFAYWAISPLFRNIRADDALPQAAKDTEMQETAQINTPVSNPPNIPPIATSPITENLSAAVIGTVGHPASGTVRIVSADGKNYVRYENYKTINGPDIYVYLAKDLDAQEFVNLGKVKATEGNINYEIPSDVNPDDYPYVLTWCKIFGVLFNSAKLQ